MTMRHLARLAELVRRMIGVPDYEHYLAHMRTHHAQCVPLPPDAFARDALARRYEKPGNRCC